MGPDWFWVLIFSLGGISMGFITSLVGLPKGAEFLGWIILYGFWVGATTVLQIHAPFLTLLVASILAGACAATIQTLFMPIYRRKNPWYEEHMQSGFWKTALGFYGFALLAGIVFGAIIGTVGWGLALL